MHPYKRDRVRAFIAHRSLWTLSACFILSYPAAALIASAPSTLLRLPDGHESALGHLWALSRDTLSFLFSHDATALVSDTYPVIVMFVLHGFAMLAPGFFFGVVVFKYFVPRKKLIIWSKRLDLFEQGDGHVLSPMFYIASRLDIASLNFTVVLRVYESRYESGENGRYPLKSTRIHASWSEMFLPYPFVPSTFGIPIVLFDPASPPQTLKPETVYLALDDNQTLSRLLYEDVDVDIAQGDWAELHILAQGPVPELDSNLCEATTYDLTTALRTTPGPRPQTPYNRDKRAFDVSREEWRKFRN